MNKIMGYSTQIVDEWENVFELAMIVPGFAYYANYEESDENGNTIVVNDKNGILIYCVSLVILIHNQSRINAKYY